MSTTAESSKPKMLYEPLTVVALLLANWESVFSQYITISFEAPVDS